MPQKRFSRRLKRRERLSKNYVFRQKREKDRGFDKPRRVCLARNEFPQGTVIHLLRLLATERNAKGVKAFRRWRKGRETF
jgi:hypothetical protein